MRKKKHIMWLGHVKTIINHPYFDGLYHPFISFILLWGMVYEHVILTCFNHILSRPRLWWRQPFRHLPQVLRVDSVELTPGCHGQAEVAFFKARRLGVVENPIEKWYLGMVDVGLCWFYGIGLPAWVSTQMFWRFFLLRLLLRSLSLFHCFGEGQMGFWSWRRDLSCEKSSAGWDCKPGGWVILCWIGIIQWELTVGSVHQLFLPNIDICSLMLLASPKEW